MKAYVA